MPRNLNIEFLNFSFLYLAYPRIKSNVPVSGISCEVLRQVYANFGMETFQEEQQKAIDIKFFESNDVFFLLPIGYEKSLLSSSASDRSPLLSRRKRSQYLLCRTLKLSQKTRCTILKYKGREDCPPSTLRTVLQS